MLGLAAFSIGLVAMNALMTASMGGAFSASGHHPRFYHAIAWTGAAYSFVIGIIFLFGISDHLPAARFVNAARALRHSESSHSHIHSAVARNRVLHKIEEKQNSCHCET